MNLKRTRYTLAAIVVIAGLSLLAVIPKGPDLSLKWLGIDYAKPLKIHEGLDLKGGSHLVYEADMSKIQPKDRDSALRGAADVIDKRVNSLGVAEPLVQTNTSAGASRIIVELPGVTDVAEASNLIGRTVNLEIWEVLGPNEAPSTDPLLVQQQLSGFKRTGLTGKDLKRATVGFDETSGEPEILLDYNAEGSKQFAEISRRNVGKRVPISIDAGSPGGLIISSPTIQEEISNGTARITGGFEVEEAKDLAKQLNSGALPVPIKLAEQRTVGPTLGQDSVERSLTAGLVGLLLVSLFMIFYYRLPGVLAVAALLVYTGIMITLFKLIPVTLTLAGIAGFILSIGFAVDANILIFERMKEELRAGRPLNAAVEVGFSRAFASIRDSNMASVLIALILIFFNSGTVRGFAVVLLIGVGVSFFSAITVSRTFVRLTARTRLGNRLRLWGLRKSESEAARTA